MPCKKNTLYCELQNCQYFLQIVIKKKVVKTRFVQRTCMSPLLVVGTENGKESMTKSLMVEQEHSIC